MAKLKEIMAEINYGGNPVKSLLVKIPAILGKHQTDIENLEFSILDLVLMDSDLSILLKDIFNLGIVLQTFRTTEKIWRNAPPETRLPEWSHVKVNLFNNDPESDDRAEELMLRRRRKDPRRDPRRRDDFDMSMPVDVDHEENVARNKESLGTNPDREVEIRTVSPIQDSSRDPRTKNSKKRDPRKVPGRLERDPRKSTSQEKDARRSSTEDRKSPSQERDPRRRVSPIVQLPVTVIPPDKVELPQNRLQPLSTFPQKANKPISKVMPMVKEMDHKDPRRRKKLPEITSDPVLETGRVELGVGPQQAEPVPNVPSSSSLHSSKPSQEQMIQGQDGDSDSDDGELKIDIKEPEEDSMLETGPNEGTGTVLGAVSKSQLLKKLLPHKFGAIEACEERSKKSDASLSMSVNLMNKESDWMEPKKNTILDDSKKSSMTGLDDSFGLWDEVYGVTETVGNDTNIESKAKTDPVDSTATKVGVNFKEFAKNMVRNTLMKPPNNSPKRKPSQESTEEKDVGEELVIDSDKPHNDDVKINPEVEDEATEKTEVVVEELDVVQESDEEMKQLEMNRDDCRKKIEDLEKESRDFQQRELLLSLEKERDRLNKTIESEDAAVAAQALKDEIEDGEIADSDEEENEVIEVAKSSDGERNISMESPKALEIDEHSPSPSPPHQRSDIFVTIRHDTPKAVVRNKPPKIHRTGRKTASKTSVPKNPVLRSERMSSDEVMIISSSAEEEEKTKNRFEGKTQKSKKVKMETGEEESTCSDNSEPEMSVYKKDGDSSQQKRKRHKGTHQDRKGGSISENDETKSGEKRSQERYPKYWEEFEQQIESKKKPGSVSRSQENTVFTEEKNPGMFAEETVWLNNQKRSNHWTRKSVESIIGGLNKNTKTGHKPNIDIEVLEMPEDLSGEDCSPNINFWGAQKRLQPPSAQAAFAEIQEKTGFVNNLGKPDFTSNIQEKRSLGAQEDLNKRFKRNDWAHFSKTGRVSEEKREIMGMAGIGEIGKGGVGSPQHCGLKTAKIPSLMDIHVSPPKRRPPFSASKSATFVEASPSQKSESEQTCGMDFVENIKKKVSVLAESHKKKMETIGKNNEAKEDTKEKQVKRSPKDDDEHAFLCFYEGDAMLDDQDENDLEEPKDEEIKANLPLPVPCIGKASTKPPQETLKTVPISPVVNRREVMEEAFGLGSCLTKMKNDESLKNPSSSNLAAPLPSKGCLNVSVEEVETPKPAPMITPPPPMISQAKWRVNSDTSVPPTKAEIYRHTLGLDNKNPITALHELCQRNKWSVPKFKETESPGGKTWSISAFVNGKEFSPSKVQIKKKDAKLEAARICLQEIGVL